MKGLEGGNGNKNAVLNYTFIQKRKRIHGAKRFG